VTARHIRSERTAAVEPRQAKSSTGATAFTIQIASSTNERHARAMVNELKDAGHAAYLVEPPAAHGGAYQVRVGRYLTLAEADRWARSLERSLGWRLRVTTAVR
jgi:cell division septation protein DedD